MLAPIGNPASPHPQIMHAIVKKIGGHAVGEGVHGCSPTFPCCDALRIASHLNITDTASVKLEVCMGLASRNKT